MSLIEFELPSFLRGTTARSIEQNMLKNLPADLDKTEGGFVWDLTYPTALEKAELIQYYMVVLLKIMFPMWAEGKWLDLHARECGLERRAANAAYGYIHIEGAKGLVIPSGFKVAVPSTNGSEAITYHTLSEIVLSDMGKADVAIQADETGAKGNVDAGTVSIMVSPMSGITRINNDNEITGGAEAEDDESLRQRVDDYNAGRGDSYVGNNADYVRWAKEVPGVGYAHTIPEYNGPNSVKVIVVDVDGKPANEQIVKAVKLHIFGENRKDIKRLAPVGVVDYVVTPPVPKYVDISFKLKLKEYSTEDKVISDFKQILSEYYASIVNSDTSVNPVKYVHVAALLEEINGVDDFKELMINGGITNISFSEEEYPVTREIEVDLYE